MKTAALLVVAVLTASSAFAQSERGYIQATGGWDNSSSSLGSSLTSGYGGAQGGVQAGKHVAVFGELGRFKNLQPGDVQMTVDQTVASLSSNAGLDVTGTSRIRATYGLGGVRFQGTVKRHVTPYALGAIGTARVTPSAAFQYTDGLLPNTDPTSPVPPVGTDVTSDIVSAGFFTQPAKTNAFMLALGGGAQITLAKHLIGDVGYRYSRIATDTPLHTNAMTFGVGVRF